MPIKIILHTNRIAQTLVDCMKKTECVKKGREMRECLKDSGETGECQEFRAAYFNCKRGGLDARSRIRGPRVY